MPAVEPHLAPLPLRAAMEARDLQAVVNAFAPDAVLHSPFTDGLVFTGRDQIAAVTKVVMDAFTDWRYTDEVRGDGSAVLIARARVGGEDIEMTEYLRLRPDGKVGELTVFFRPLPATAAALRLIGTGLGRRKGPLRAALISALTRPLAFMTKTGDGLGVKLVRDSI
jgi:hypothetical protein